MPMIVPHQSQVGISTANGGQTAPYRSASAFMTPGQAAAPEGLKQLARGMDKLGGAVNALLLERQNMRNAADLLADKIAYEDALRDFDSNYRQTHQGVSARDAEEAYAQFHQEQYRRLQEKWGGNPWLMQGVNRMAEGIRQPSMSRAVAYRDSEEEAYKKSLLESSRAQTFQTFADPSRSWQEKEAALQAEENNLRMFAGQRPVMVDGRIQWQGGKDVTAQVMALRQRLEAEHVNGLIATNQLDAARAFLGGGAGGYGGVLNGRTYTGGGTVRGLPADIDAKIEAEAGRQGFDPVLAKAIAMQESGGRQGEVSKAGAVGVMQIIPKYAGEFGGGDVRGNVDDNIRVGIKEISTYLKRYGGDLRKALLAYNWGPGNVDAWLKTGRGVKGQPMPQEAREYADRVLGRISGGSFTQAPRGQDGKHPEMYVAYDNPEGLTEQGNIDLADRPQVKTEDGGTATVRSMSVNFDGAEVLLPTVSQDGRLLSEDEAIAEYKKTGKHLGKFDTPEHASDYAQKLHEQQERMYLGGEASGGPQSSSLSAAARAQFSMHIDAMERRNELAAKQAEKEAKSKAADDAYNSIHAAVQGLPPQEQEARAASFIAAIPDPDMRKSMLSRLKDDIAVESMRQKATDYEQGRKYRELVQTQGLLPSQALAGVDSIQGMSDEGREKLRASLNKEAQKATPQNTQALNDLLRQIDTGAIAEDTAIDSYAFDKSLTDKQVKQAKEYLQKGGNKGGVSFSRVERIYKRMGKGKTMPPDVFELVLQNIEPGKPATDERLQQTLANLYMEGESIGSGWWWDKDETYADALEQGRGDTWLPDVTEAEKKAITAVLRQAGIIVTDERIRKYKKYELMRIGAGR